MKKHPEKKNVMLEPFEEVIIEADLDYSAMIIDKMNGRKGVLLSADETSDGK